jgi:hypothetical protein
MKFSVAQIKKSSVKCLDNRVQYCENRLSGLQNKVEELAHCDKNKNTRKVQMEHARSLRHHQKLTNYGYRRRRHTS